MNRLILVGNGFDLAKGLESGYQHFIDWMWKNIIDKVINIRPNSYEDDFVIIDNYSVKPNAETTYDYKTLKEFLQRFNGSIKFKNEFFGTISKQASLNWVDIETAYFNALKNILQDEKAGKVQKQDIKTLNTNFEQIKHKLQEYLTNQLITFSLPEFYSTNLSENFNPLDFTRKGVEEFEKECQDPNDSSQISRILEIKNKMKLGDYSNCDTYIFPKEIIFLNFNYTDLIPQLIKIIKTNDNPSDKWQKSKMEHIYIHGELNKQENPIIFGYGDENDEIQSEIEKRGGDYLNNIKTINYLKTPNYKKVLSFLDSDNYQVFIMGHSCGLSDKTLLKTIFEHPNCISIRPFYHTDKDGNNNYNDIVRNIYRTFTDKALMRDKVVNEKYCCELKV